MDFTIESRWNFSEGRCYLAQIKGKQHNTDSVLGALQSYQHIFKADYDVNVMHDSMAPIWQSVREIVLRQREIPPTFFLTHKFLHRLETTLQDMVAGKMEPSDFDQFLKTNARNPYPVTLYYPNGKTPILGVNTLFGSCFIWQIFMPSDSGGHVLLKNQTTLSESLLVMNEKGISDLDAWRKPQPQLNNEYLEAILLGVMDIVSLSSVAMKSPAIDCLPVNSQNKVTKIRDQKDEHKLYRVRLLDNLGSKSAPLFYVPRKEHDVRGHPRTYKSGKTIWIKDHKRGDKNLGVVTKDYFVD